MNIPQVLPPDVPDNLPESYQAKIALIGKLLLHLFLKH